MKNLPANGGDAGLIPALGNPLERATHCTILAGESHDSPGAWQAAVLRGLCGVTESWSRLSN